jgi:hypothetical protein
VWGEGYGCGHEFWGFWNCGYMECAGFANGLVSEGILDKLVSRRGDLDADPNGSQKWAPT